MIGAKECKYATALLIAATKNVRLAYIRQCFHGDIAVYFSTALSVLEFSQNTLNVIPAKAGIQLVSSYWIPAFAGMTRFCGTLRKPYNIIFISMFRALFNTH
jgi:hypothetical protein